MQAFQEITLNDITPSPLNPRKNFTGQKFNDLVASVREKGVIEPVIVRPVKKPSGKALFELVAGERRFRAAGDCNLPTIPAIVRELTDDEAYDFMLIENLHREDLTELEEAESFKAYVERHGEDGIPTFASKTGISPRYIRARIQVLSLSKDVLSMWRDGKLKYGHLEQLLRVDDANVRGELVKLLREREGYRRLETVAELRKEIDELQINLSQARFPTKSECAGCRNNSAVQQDLFGVGDKKASCTNPECFKEKQRAWLTANWEKTSFRKEQKTNGFRFNGEVDWSHRKDFNNWSGADRPRKECFSCEKFVSIIHVDGKAEEKQTCLDPGCYKRLEAGAKAKKAGKSAAEMPRAAWHGEFFRDRFLRPKIEAKVKDLQFAASDGLAVLLAAIAASRHVDKLPHVLGRGSADRYGYYNRRPIVAALLDAKAPMLFAAARTIVADFVLEGQSIDEGESIHFDTTDRAALGRFLGIDLAKEYAVNEEYLQKKTTAEILAFIKKFGLGTSLQALKGKAPEKAKKSELVKAVLAIGADLVGKVPDEILNVEKTKKGSGR